MGSYSWTDYCDIKVRPGMRESFQKYLVDLAQRELPDWIEYGKEHARVISLSDDDTVEISIDSWKIISYWYDSTLDFFDELSQYLDGELYLSFETSEHCAIVHFSSEGTTYELGTMKYDTFTGNELRDERKRIDALIDKVLEDKNGEQ